MEAFLAMIVPVQAPAVPPGGGPPVVSPPLPGGVPPVGGYPSFPAPLPGGPVVSPPIYYPPGIWGPTDPRPTPPIYFPPTPPTQPVPPVGVWPSPGPLPIPTPPIYYPPTQPVPPVGIWPSPGPLPIPTPPIYYPPVVWPTPPVGEVPPDGGEGGGEAPQRPIDWKVAWSPATGWIVVGVPSGEHPTPSKE